MNEEILRCNDIDYRQGFIEVTANIHPGHVNIETWNLDPGLDISTTVIRSTPLPEGAVIGNTEIELNLQQAKALIQSLQLAVESAEQSLAHRQTDLNG